MSGVGPDAVTTGGPVGEPWPGGTRRTPDGSLAIGDVDVRDLAAEHGTPTYLLDEADFRRRARTYRTAFEDAFAEIGAGVDVYYAGKAFLSVAVARWAHEEGLRVDTASGGELETALRAGVPAADIGLHGNNKSDAEIARALDVGVGRIIVDSLVEIDRIALAAGERGVVAPVMVRVTTGIHAGGHEYISTAHEDQKFGLSIAPGPDGGRSPAFVALRAVLARPELQLLGIHSHIGSQILDPGGFEQAIGAVLELRADLAQATGTLVDEVDIGGGYGIAYLPGEVPLDPERIAKGLACAASDEAALYGTPLPRFSIEPGRAIVGPAGVTLYTVGTVKPVTVTVDESPDRESAGPVDGHDGAVGPIGSIFVRTYVSVDGGMSDNIRPALYDAQYHAEIAGRASTAEPVLARVVGKHCESGDILVHEVMLPGDVRAGDLLAVAASGAYGRSMASNYNMLPRPPVVAVTAGESRVLVRRETLDDLLGLDQG